MSIDKASKQVRQAMKLTEAQVKALIEALNRFEDAIEDGEAMPDSLDTLANIIETVEA